MVGVSAIGPGAVFGTPGMAVVTANGSVASRTGDPGPGGYDDLINAARAMDA